MVLCRTGLLIKSADMGHDFTRTAVLKLDILLHVIAILPKIDDISKWAALYQYHES